MLDKIPFDTYDFFGYLASGLVVILGMEMILGFPEVIGQDLNIIDVGMLFLGMYIAGQIVATPAKSLLENIVVTRLLGRPNINLFRKKKPRLRAFLFPGFFTTLHQGMQERIVNKASRQGCKETSGEALFLHVRYSSEVIINDKLIKKLDAFINKYGFNRNLSFSCFLLGLAFLVSGYVSPEPNSEFIKYGIISLVLSNLLFYRYLFFFRQYSYELFNTYGGMDKEKGV